MQRIQHETNPFATAATATTATTATTANACAAAVREGGARSNRRRRLQCRRHVGSAIFAAARLRRGGRKGFGITIPGTQDSVCRHRIKGGK